MLMAVTLKISWPVPNAPVAGKDKPDKVCEGSAVMLSNLRPVASAALRVFTTVFKKLRLLILV